MNRNFEPPRESTPEEAAVTGGVPAAAEPAPQTRSRRSSYAAFAWLELLVGAVLVLVGLLTDQGPGERAGTIIAGIALIAASLLVMTGMIGPVLFATLSFAGGVVIGIAAFTATDFGVAEAMLVGASALTFLGAFGSLASSRTVGSTAAEEPRAGVENV